MYTQFTRPFPLLQKWVWLARLVQTVNKLNGGLATQPYLQQSTVRVSINRPIKQRSGYYSLVYCNLGSLCTGERSSLCTVSVWTYHLTTSYTDKPHETPSIPIKSQMFLCAPLYSFHVYSVRMRLASESHEHSTGYRSAGITRTRSGNFISLFLLTIHSSLGFYLASRGRPP